MLTRSNATSVIKLVHQATRNGKHRATKPPARIRSLHDLRLLPTSWSIDRFVIQLLHELVDRLVGDARKAEDAVVYPHENVRLGVLICCLHEPRRFLMVD